MSILMIIRAFTLDQAILTALQQNPAYPDLHGQMHIGRSHSLLPQTSAPLLAAHL
jgi:hypothetical protein